MSAYWVKFKDASAGCVEAATEGLDTDDAIKLVTSLVYLRTGKKLVSISILPYPAEPRLLTMEYVDSKGQPFVCPSFCYSPFMCVGLTTCPKRRSCVD